MHLLLYILKLVPTSQYAVCGPMSYPFPWLSSPTFWFNTQSDMDFCLLWHAAGWSRRVWNANDTLKKSKSSRDRIVSVTYEDPGRFLSLNITAALSFNLMSRLASFTKTKEDKFVQLVPNCFAYFVGATFLKAVLLNWIEWVSALVSTTLQYSLRKLLGFHRQWYRVLAIGLTFFIFFFDENINDRVDQNPMATGTVLPIKI